MLEPFFFDAAQENSSYENAEFKRKNAKELPLLRFSF